MKNFLKTTLAVVCALILVGIFKLFVFLGIIGSLSLDGSENIPAEGVLDINLSQIAVTEQGGGMADPMAVLSNTVQSIGIWDAVRAINRAAADNGVKYIFLRADGAALSISRIEELRRALSAFRSSGKAVIAYTETPSTGSYWLSSVADKIYMSNAVGFTPMMTGVGSQMFFLKDILDKFGVNVQLIRHGKYKSAGEMYIRNSPSKENMEQNQAMINSLWNTIASDIEQSRGLEKGSLTYLVDGLKLNFPSDFIEAGLADELVSKEELRAKLATFSLAESWDKVALIPFGKYASASIPEYSKDKIAVIYAEGNIVDGTQGEGVLGDKYASIISDIRKNDKVKAVVLRVSSPGGSVSASDKIKTELDLLCKEKTVVASYGDYAASGGYWISNGAAKIYTDATTLTGSIGVFSMIPDFSKTAKNIAHVGVYSVGSSSHSDMFSGMRPLDKDEVAYMQAAVEAIYGRFVEIVAEGRDLEPGFVDSIAQGRVWTGAEAMGIGLVDEIGTLEDAVSYAALSAGLDMYMVEAYPKPKSDWEMIMERLGGNYQPDVLANTPFAGIGRAFKEWNFASSERFYARVPYEFEFKL